MIISDQQVDGVRRTTLGEAMVAAVCAAGWLTTVAIDAHLLLG